jgi:tetratricopeptide (TPR) repeat protein
MARLSHATRSRTAAPAAPAANRPLLRRRAFRWIVLLGVLGTLLWQRQAWWSPLMQIQARRALERRDPDRAHRWLNAADWLVPEDGQTAFWRARAFRKQGHMEEVRRWLTRAHARGVSPERIQREEWLAQAQSGQLRQAGPHLPRLLTDPDGDAAEVCEAFVYGYIRTRRTGPALELIERWIADFPGDPWPFVLRGRLLRLLEQTGQAEEDLRRAHALAPASTEIAVELADILQRNGKPAEAVDLFLLAAADPRFAGRARLGQARCRAMRGDAAGAEALLEDLVRESPRQAEAWAELGRVRMEAGRSESALAALQSAVELWPRNLDVRYQLARALQSCGKTQDAQEHYDYVRQAREALDEVQALRDRIDRNAGDADARYRLGMLLMEYDEPEEAAVWLLGALEVEPRHAGAHAALAEHYAARARQDVLYRDLAEKHRRAAGAR